MPTYHFTCAGCTEAFEMHLPMGTTTTPACPTCRSAKNVEKIIKPPMVHFKGSGFYKTDSMAKKTGPHAAPEGSAPGKKEERTEKPVASTDAKKTPPKAP